VCLQIKAKEKVLERLQKEFTLFTDGFNARAVYFAQLQVISDQVKVGLFITGGWDIIDGLD
jgi:hypothetical protein